MNPNTPTSRGALPRPHASRLHSSRATLARATRAALVALLALLTCIAGLPVSASNTQRAVAANSEVGERLSHAVNIQPLAPRRDAGLSCVAPPSGKAHWWTGDASAEDLQGDDDGTLQGGASFSPAHVGRGFSFDSDDDGVNIPHRPTLDMQPSGFTATFWMRGVKNQPQALFAVFDKSRSFTDNAGWVFQGDSANGLISFAAGDGSGLSYVTSNTDVLDGEFHHVAATWDGNSMRLYIDGFLHSTLPFTSPANNTRPLKVGFAAGDVVPQSFFRGQADELEIYNRALADAEVLSLFSAGTAGQCTNDSNEAPTVNNPGDQSSSEGQSIALQISASDPEGDSLMYTASGLPPGLSINQTTGLITGTLGFNSAGSYAVNVSAYDARLRGSATFNWTVNDTASACLVVTNTNNTGAGSLRDAINCANATPVHDTIIFNIPGAGPHTIKPTPLPFIINPVTIDGYTQPGARPNTLATGSDAVLKIELDGSLTGFQAQASGLEITGGGSTIRGLAINRFHRSAISIGTANVVRGGNRIEGNYLGTDTTGTIALGNRADGVNIFNSFGNTVGGNSPAARNVISGNQNNGVEIDGGNNPADTNGNRVVGNLIGTTSSGVSALPNNAGVNIAFGATQNFVGGVTSEERNIISGNNYSGVSLTGVPNNYVQGNYVGTDATGTLALPNSAIFGGAGIDVNNGSTGSIIGGLTDTPGTGAGNLISGNRSHGVNVRNCSHGNTVQGNMIGLKAGGGAALGNAGNGVEITFCPNNTVIGGAQAGARNVISANGGYGVVVVGGGSGTQVKGNYIGTGADGITNFGNGQDGVFLSNCPNQTIGGTAPGEANRIAFNRRNGVRVSGLQNNNPIRGNSIFRNDRLGINLQPFSDCEACDFVSLNDTGDADTGPNRLQNFPVLDSVSTSGGATNVAGTLNSTANTQFAIDFFSNSVADPSGFGEGETYIGTATVLTDASGNAAFNVTLPFAVSAGQLVTTTATDPDGNTSEFSATRLVVNANQPPVANTDAGIVAEDSSDTITVLANDSDPNGDTLNVTGATQGANGSVVVNPDGTLTYTPNANFNGADSFTYTLSDGHGGTATASVSLTIAPVNDAPLASDGAAGLDEDMSVEIILSASDIDSASLSYIIVAQPTHGTLSPVVGNHMVYTPAPNYNGPDSFTFTASDGSLTSNTATVSIIVAPVNDAPVLANIGNQTVAEGALLSFTLNGSDPDGDALVYSSSALPAGASLDAASGALNWTPNYNQSGIYTVTFTVRDTSGLSASETIRITVTDVVVNQGPVCSAAYPSIAEIWPPNHKKTEVVKIFGVTDPDGDPLTIRIARVLQDEPTNTDGDGSTWIDGGGIGTSQAWVRAERSGTPKVPGNGRVYEIFFDASDNRGKSCTGTVKVGVPHDQGNKHVLIDDGKRYDSTVAGGPCLNCH
jgi:hypothetical protein